MVPVRKMAGKLQLLFKWIQDIESKKLPLRVVIVEDGIDPATLSQLREVEHFSFVRIYSGQFDSPGLARNHGLAKVETEWVAFWDSDDLPDPSVIHQEVEVAPPWINVLVGAFKVKNIKTGKNSRLIKQKSLSEIGFKCIGRNQTLSLRLFNSSAHAVIEFATEVILEQIVIGL